jgi:glutamate 5-kinase
MRRVVIKVGTHVLSQGEELALDRISALVEFLSSLQKSGYEVILVSSGAVAAGYTRLAIDKSQVANRQALASIGQPLLLSVYREQFDKHDIICSQVLLGAHIFDSRRATQHAKSAIETLLANSVIPIINENDTVSVEELVFGDNDRLSAHVAHYFDADMLVLLSDIDALYDKDPNSYSDATVRREVDSITQEELEADTTAHNEFATGGIVTKLQAADFLMKHNRKLYLASGFNLGDVKSFLIDGVHKGGTLFSR